MNIKQQNKNKEKEKKKESSGNAYILFLILILLLLSEDVLSSIQKLLSNNIETKILPADKK